MPVSDNLSFVYKMIGDAAYRDSTTLLKEFPNVPVDEYRDFVKGTKGGMAAFKQYKKTGEVPKMLKDFFAGYGSSDSAPAVEKDAEAGSAAAYNPTASAVLLNNRRRFGRTMLVPRS